MVGEPRFAAPRVYTHLIALLLLAAAWLCQSHEDPLLTVSLTGASSCIEELDNDESLSLHQRRAMLLARAVAEHGPLHEQEEGQFYSDSKHSQVQQHRWPALSANSSSSKMLLATGLSKSKSSSDPKAPQVNASGAAEKGTAQTVVVAGNSAPLTVGEKVFELDTPTPFRGQPHRLRSFEPTGVISNVFDGNVVWWRLDHLSYRYLLGFIALVYPVIIPATLLSLMMLVSICLRPRDDISPEELKTRHRILLASDLTDGSKSLYVLWATLCYFIPAILVFGTCLIVCLCIHFRPQESYVILLTVGSFFFFSTSVHQAGYVPWLLHEMDKVNNSEPKDILDGVEDSEKVRHWLILPNYNEEEDVLEMAVESVAQSSIAKTQIGLVLAMEQREKDSVRKSENLKTKFEKSFMDILITFHPPDLPNDPPGKASNTAWAYRKLAEHLDIGCQEILHRIGDEEWLLQRTKPLGPRDPSMVVLTVADADSCFHRLYFESLTKDFMSIKEGDRHRHMWQAPVYHMKNYHNQPAPVAVGSIFTGLIEGSLLADPNSVRFPYSTYSLPLLLAEWVGGWDPQWIAEDWHMGIKCYLLMLGRMNIRTLVAPIINYTPESTDGTWVGTLRARLTQAKRHALGFSDVAYIFMTLPLIFQYLLKMDSLAVNTAHFPRLLCQSILCIIRLINTHVLIGVLLIYSIISLVMGFTSESMLVVRGGGCAAVFTAASFILIGTSATVFTILHHKLKERLDPASGGCKILFDKPYLHIFYVTGICVLIGPVFFMAVAYCAWNAAYQTAKKSLNKDGFEYEVAPKPSLARPTDKADAVA